DTPARSSAPHTLVASPSTAGRGEATPVLCLAPKVDRGWFRLGYRRWTRSDSKRLLTTMSRGGAPGQLHPVKGCCPRGRWSPCPLLAARFMPWPRLLLLRARLTNLLVKL